VRKVILSLVASVAIAAPLIAETTQKKASHGKHPASKSSSRSAKTATAKSGTHGTSAKTSGKTTAAKGKSKSKSKTVRNTARSYQQAPTTERYQEIQQALAKKGFFQGEASGKWGPDSAEALKRFQAEQNLTPDGKINSLSLIALGLGPKRLSAQSKSGSSTPSTTPAPQ
jgi:peptidoglycan hydrolase-like protein with peptidoglycan-binding domain